MTPEAQARTARKLLDSLIGRPIREQDDLVLAFARQVRREAFREAVAIAGQDLQYRDNRVRYHTAREIVETLTRLAEAEG